MALAKHRQILLFAIALMASVPAWAQSGAGPSECVSFPCGVVESIRQTAVRESWTPLGGTASTNPLESADRTNTYYRIGPNLSNQGMVVLGPNGGATYSNKKSPSTYEQMRWEVTVKLDSGQKRVLSVAYEPFVREGDRVRVAGKSLERVD